MVLGNFVNGHLAIFGDGDPFGRPWIVTEGAAWFNCADNPRHGRWMNQATLPPSSAPQPPLTSDEGEGCERARTSVTPWTELRRTWRSLETLSNGEDTARITIEGLFPRPSVNEQRIWEAPQLVERIVEMEAPRRVLSANSPSWCSAQRARHGCHLRANRGGPVRGHPSGRTRCTMSARMLEVLFALRWSFTRTSFRSERPVW